MATADLIILPLQSSAPPPAPISATFYIFNARPTTRSLPHDDDFNTPFVEVQFPVGALSSLDGAPLGAQDSVRVTLSAEAGVYGVEITPGGLRFAAAARPNVKFTYVKYGDLTVAAGSRYADADAYAAALDLWREVGLDLWSNVGGSGTVGTDLRASITESGRYVAAAPR